MNSAATCAAIRAAPDGAWQWSQTWRNLLFVHWQVGDDRLRELLPAELELDRWNGSAWVSAVAFRLAKVRLAGFPPLPLVSNFLELNLRTYVVFRGEPGVYFLTMHAASRVAVAAARWLTPLPYRFAPLSCESRGDEWRWRCGATSSAQPSLLNGDFQIRSQAAKFEDGSLDAWLLERYRAFVPNRRGVLYRMVVEHSPWQASQMDCHIHSVACEPSLGITLSREPARSHFAAGVEAHVWPFEPVDPSVPYTRVDSSERGRSAGWGDC